MRRSRRLNADAAAAAAPAAGGGAPTHGWRKWLPHTSHLRRSGGGGGTSSAGGSSAGGAGGSSAGGTTPAAAAAAGAAAAHDHEHYEPFVADPAYDLWTAAPVPAAARPRGGGGLAASRSVPHMTDESLTRLLALGENGGGAAGGGARRAGKGARANGGDESPTAVAAAATGGGGKEARRGAAAPRTSRASVDAGRLSGAGGAPDRGDPLFDLGGSRRGGRANRGARATVDLGAAAAAGAAAGGLGAGVGGVGGGSLAGGAGMGGASVGGGGGGGGLHATPAGVSSTRPGFGGRLSAFRHRNFGSAAAAAAAAAGGDRPPPPARRRVSLQRGLGGGTGLDGALAGITGVRARGGSAASAGAAAAGDVGKREAYRSGYDPLALLRRLPPSVASAVEVRVSGSRWLPHAWTPHWAELRGRLVVLLDADAAGWGDAPTATGASAAVGGSGDAAVRALFSTHRLFVSRRGRGGTTLRLRRAAGAAATSVWLRFADETAAGAWEKALVLAAASRVVGVSDFVFVAPIGKGASGKVFLVRDRVTGERLALKVIDKRKVFDTRSGFRHAVDERLALQLTAGHPFFTQLRYAFQTRTNLYVALAFCDGGDLFQYLRTHGGRLREPQLRLVAAEVLLALEELHALGFVYRDLKPENVLLDRDGHVRLADFGLCKQLRNQLTSTICGTHTYAAPETLSGMAYNTSIDCWALGIFLYHLLRGRTPYEAPTLEQVIHKMSHSPVKFASSTSPELTSLITGLLDFKPANRLGCGLGGVTALRSHPFFAGIDWAAVRRGAPHADALSTSAPSPAGGPPPPPEPLRARRRPRSAGGAGNAPPTAADGVAVDAPDGMQDELRNFDLAEWGHVSIDNDRDDATYGDDTLWPPLRAKRRICDELFVVGFAYATSLPSAVPPGLSVGR